MIRSEQKLSKLTSLIKKENTIQITHAIELIREEQPFEGAIGLLTSCWQSGLNYSEFSCDLAEVFIRGDYITAIECLTVIEESVPELNRETKDKIVKTLEESPPSEDSGKRSLTLELISILER